MNVGRNLKWGLRWGLIMAVGFTAIGVVAGIGASFDPTPRNDPSLVSLVGFYFLAGTCVGLLLGLLRPLTQSKAGAIVVGTALAAISIGLLARIYVVTDGWTLVDTIGVAMYSLVTGPVAASIIWHVRERSRSAPSDPRDFRQ
jgi:multisubunit Na+/H+ antiporter MnhG subunit